MCRWMGVDEVGRICKWIDGYGCVDGRGMMDVRNGWLDVNRWMWIEGLEDGCVDEWM